MAVQAPQIALARAEIGDPGVTTVVNDVGLELAIIADVPAAVLCAVITVMIRRSQPAGG